ncbi:MAG: hypothetical protein SPI25_02210 [Dialister sp.]|nr:hypothetical protein [Dialister sp.]
MKQLEEWRAWILKRPVAEYELCIAVPFCVAVLFLAEGSFLWRLPSLFYIWLLFPAVEDAVSGYMTDVWWMVLMAAGIVYRSMDGILLEGILPCLICLFLLGLPFLFWPGSIGGGDVCLASAIGFWLTPLTALCFIWIASVLCLLLFFILTLVSKKSVSAPIRFGPCLALAGGVSYGAAQWLSDILVPLSAGISLY